MLCKSERYAVNKQNCSCVGERVVLLILKHFLRMNNRINMNEFMNIGCEKARKTMDQFSINKRHNQIELKSVLSKTIHQFFNLNCIYSM